VGHHGGHGTTAAAMVHRVVLIYMSFVDELYIKYTFTPNKFFFIAREQLLERSQNSFCLCYTKIIAKLITNT
jgi:hypothetical protein